MSGNIYVIMILLAIVCVAAVVIVHLLDVADARGDRHRSRSKLSTRLELPRMTARGPNRRRPTDRV